MLAGNVLSDLASHRIEGFAPDRDEPFEIPLVSHIAGNLWMGGCIPGVRLPAAVAHVVSLYAWGSYAIEPGTRRLRVAMSDHAAMPDLDELDALAGYVLDAVAQGPTLVHCQAGLNRSGLVAAYALVLDGMAPADAIGLLRERRSPQVLCNPVFEAWLLDVPSDPAARRPADQQGLVR
jgi:hypothetical protein